MEFESVTYTLGLLVIFIASSSLAITLILLGLRLMFCKHKKLDTDKLTIIILRGPISITILCIAVIFVKCAVACIAKFQT